MITVYIKELDKIEINENSNFFQKYLSKLKNKIIKILNLIKIKEIEQSKKIYLIPNPSKTSVYKRVVKKLEKEKTKTEKVQIVLSNKLKKYEQFLRDCKILDGKPVYRDSIEPILKEILGEYSLELQDIYILTDYYQEKNINLIRNLASKVKTINVVTKEIEKYKIIEEMFQEQGILISVSNNKRKSLKRAKIIINLDFQAEKLKKYIIFRNAVLINLTEEKLTNLKGFEGIIIRDIQLKLKSNQKEFIITNELEDFRQIEIYESMQNMFSQSNKIKIAKLYGNNGQISQKELDNLRINFCEFSVKN